MTHKTDEKINAVSELNTKFFTMYYFVLIG